MTIEIKYAVEYDVNKKPVSIVVIEKEKTTQILFSIGTATAVECEIICSLLNNAIATATVSNNISNGADLVKVL